MTKTGRAVARTRRINAATRVVNVANGSLRYMLETSLVLGSVLVVVLVVAVAGAPAGATPCCQLWAW